MLIAGSLAVCSSAFSMPLADGLAVCTAVDAQTGPAITTDGSAGTIIAWQDNRSGSDNIGTILAWQDHRNDDWDIYAEGLCIFGTGIGDLPVVEVSNFRNSPNPFADMTTISFALTSGSPVSISVYDINGRLVTTLADGVSLSEGNHEVVWNGSDMNGESVSAGVYFCRISTSETSGRHSIVVVR
jgi:hypothetical protein